MPLFERFVSAVGTSPINEVRAEVSGNRLCYGLVTGYDFETQKMKVDKFYCGKAIPVENVYLNTQLADTGYGLRIIPIVGVTMILMYQVTQSDYIHVGYYYGDVSQLFSDRKEEKENSTDAVLLRYLEGGEVQLVALNKNEIYLSNDGSVLLKSQYNASLKLDNVLHRLEGNFANLKYEMDSVRERAGNILRPTVPDTLEEDFILLKDEEVTKESSLEKDQDYTEITGLKEWRVDVGTEIDPETGVDYTTKDSKGRAMYPSVGYIAMADKMVTENGEEIKILDKSINFKLRLANGCSLVVDEEGSFFILDDITGNFTKFAIGDDAEKSLRVGDNMFIINKEDGVYIKHESGSSIRFDPDGNVQVNDSGDANGQNVNTVVMTAGKGITITTSNDLVLSANKIVLLPKDNIYIGDPLSAADNLLTLSGFGMNVFNGHIHPATSAFGPVTVSPPTNQATANNSSAKGIVVT
jgi:hypothetical protein